MKYINKFVFMLLTGSLFLSISHAQTSPCYDVQGMYQSPMSFDFYVQDSSFPGFNSATTGVLAFIPPTYPSINTNFKVHYSDVGTEEQNIKFYNTNPSAISLVYSKLVYYLAEFHFHSPSEHTFPGTTNTFQMELHMVFRGYPDTNWTNPPGIVIAVPIMVNATSSSFNTNLSSLLSANMVNGQTVSVPSSLFTSILNYANTSNFPPCIIYPGSLTTSPYTEGYTWIVINGYVTQPATILSSTLTQFTNLKINGQSIGSVRPQWTQMNRPVILFTPPVK